MEKININYSGEDTGLIVPPIFAQNTLAQRANFRVIQGRGSTMNFHDLDMGAKFKAQECRQTPTDESKLTQRIVNLCKLEMVGEMCHSELNQTFLELQYQAGQLNRKMNTVADVYQAILELIRRRAVVQLNAILLRGQKDYTPASGEEELELCDGLLIKLQEAIGDGGVRHVNAVPNDPTNVLAEMLKVHAALPSHVKYNTPAEAGDTVMMIDPKTADSFIGAMAVNNVTWAPNHNPNSRVLMQWLGMNIVVFNELPDYTMIATNPQNIAVFYDLSNDITQVKVIDNSATSINDTWSYKLRVAAAIDYLRANDIVLYS